MINLIVFPAPVDIVIVKATDYDYVIRHILINLIVFFLLRLTSL